MPPKPHSANTKGSQIRPARKLAKGTAETARLFIDVNDVIRRTQAMPLTRYVE